MENQLEEYERSGVKGGVASVLNFGGNALVYAYDVTTGAFGKIFSVVKKTPVVPEKAFDMFAGGFGILKPSEIKGIQEKIRVYEKKIKDLYYLIGKEGATYSGHESALETEPVKKLMADVREYEKEIQRFQGRMVEIKKQKSEEALRRKSRRRAVPSVEKKKIVDATKVKKTVESAIAKASRHGEFETRSEMEIFDKVANDLLDNDIEIKVLAAAELGKIGNEAAVPILMEAAKFDNPDLISEIINSLIMLGDSQAIDLFKEKAADAHYRVRIGCLRGLYKLAEDKDAMPVLTGALRDEHQEVRRTAATFIGWKDYSDAVPALVQCLKDDDARVRKAAVSAVANIKDESSVLPLINVLKDKDIEIREKALEAVKVISGEEISFDVHASGSELKGAISNLRDWWQKDRLSKAEIAEEIDEAEAGEEVEEVAAGTETAGEAEEVSADAEVAGEAEEAEVEGEAAEEVEEVSADAGIAGEAEEEGEAPEEAEEVSADAWTAGEAEEEGEAAEEAEEVLADAEAEEEAEGVAEEEPEFTEEKLMRMLKTELFTICQGLGIECDESMTKAEISRLILEGSQ